MCFVGLVWWLLVHFRFCRGSLIVVGIVQLCSSCTVGFCPLVGLLGVVCIARRRCFFVLVLQGLLLFLLVGFVLFWCLLFFLLICLSELNVFVLLPCHRFVLGWCLLFESCRFLLFSILRIRRLGCCGFCPKFFVVGQVLCGGWIVVRLV